MVRSAKQPSNVFLQIYEIINASLFNKMGYRHWRWMQTVSNVFHFSMFFAGATWTNNSGVP
jgi:hypothetical protein